MGYWNNLFKEKFMTDVEESRDYGTSTGETEKFRQTRGLREIITVVFLSFKENFWPNTVCFEISGKWKH